MNPILNMGFYVRPEYLEVAHYYYFSLGIFSFICGIVFGFSAVYSVVFVLLYIGLSSFSWYISWIMRKRMRDFFIPDSVGFIASHVFLTFFVGLLVFLLWSFAALREELLVEIVLYINYFVFFVALVWYLIVKFGVTKKILDLYDSGMMENSKDFIIKVRRNRKDVFSRSLASDATIKNYRTGTDPTIDEILINAWRIRNTDSVLKLIMELELKLCSRNVEILKRRLESLSSAGIKTPRDRRTMEQYEKMIAELARDSLEYEKVVSKKVPNE